MYKGGHNDGSGDGEAESRARWRSVDVRKGNRTRGTEGKQRNNNNKKEAPFCEVLMEGVVAVATSGGNGGKLLATDDAFGASSVLL